MSSSLVEFFKAHPFLGVFIIVFMVLPMIGAVVHIILKAMGKKGIDNSETDSEMPPPDDDDDSIPKS